MALKQERELDVDKVEENIYKVTKDSTHCSNEILYYTYLNLRALIACDVVVVKIIFIYK